MSALDHKRDILEGLRDVRFALKADIDRVRRDVRFVPKADIGLVLRDERFIVWKRCSLMRLLSNKLPFSL
jgi:hypothetical protein